jgi:tetratricopeptide (TPR) repeat protein
MSRLARPWHGLRVTLRMAGVVVDQQVHWRAWGALRLSPEGTAGWPQGAPALTAIWEGREAVRLESPAPGGPSGRLTPGGHLRWAETEGVQLDLDLIPREPALRWSRDSGDLPLAVLVLLLSVSVSQLSVLWELFGPTTSVSATATGMEPDPETIARLLERDLEGAEEGYAERAERAEHAEGAPSFYMPAGNQGTLGRAGGGATQGNGVSRPETESLADEAAEALAEAELPEPPTKGAPEPPPEAPTNLDPGPVPEPLLADAEEPPPPESADEAPSPMERFIGWGFRDWFDVRDARPENEHRIRRELDVARRRLRINPDDPGALNVVGYYSYLAENQELCRETYQRYIELYPEDPAGYNNLALTYKRSGEYQTEEAMYRKALELDPLDVNVLNNLAVNLAHQGRYTEALEWMALLEELDPGDPYAELHRAKIHAAMGHRERAYQHLKDALEGMKDLDTLHHIEFRQDLRVDPVFDELRSEDRFARILRKYYGKEADYLLTGRDRRARRGGEGG